MSLRYDANGNLIDGVTLIGSYVVDNGTDKVTGFIATENQLNDSFGGIGRVPKNARSLNSIGDPGIWLGANVGYLYNGTNWDMQQGNTQGTLLASAARTATTNTPNQTNYNARGVMLTLDITASPNTTETLSILIIIPSPLGSNTGGQYASFTTPAGSTILTGGIYKLIVYPNSAAATDTPANMKSVSLVVPRTFVGSIAPSGASAWTYALSYSLIL